jgi:hypothetical protein
VAVSIVAVNVYQAALTEETPLKQPADGNEGKNRNSSFTYRNLCVSPDYPLHPNQARASSGKAP